MPFVSVRFPYWLVLHFSALYVLCRIFQSCTFTSCFLCRIFQSCIFNPLQLSLCRLFMSCIFSRPIRIQHHTLSHWLGKGNKLPLHVAMSRVKTLHGGSQSIAWHLTGQWPVITHDNIVSPSPSMLCIVKRIQALFTTVTPIYLSPVSVGPSQLIL